MAQALRTLGVDFEEIDVDSDPRLDELYGADVPVLQPYVKEGRVKAMVIYDTKRSPKLPDVPTATEVGLPQLQMSNWYAVLVPAGVPADVKAQLETALLKAVKTPEVAKIMDERGFSGTLGTQAFKTKLAAEFDRWSPFLAKAGIKAQ